MSDRKALNRRSFMARITGIAAAGMAIATKAQAQPTDMDRNDSPGRMIPYNAITDNDHNDTAGHGRGAYTGHNDHDGMDASRHGRDLPNTDRDMADRAGHGRNRPATAPTATTPPTSSSGPN